MSRDEAISNLGTIAKSGTQEFFSQLTGDQQKDAHLIGQFGVGFYSSFIVADKVTVHTRRAGETPAQGVRWESDGGGDFSVEMAEKPTRGTEITLHLREGQEDLLNGSRLRSIIRKYSDHIVQPILMKKEEWKDGKQEKEPRRRPSTRLPRCGRAAHRDHRRAVQGVLQARRPRLRDPLAWTHARVEGRQEFTHLLYVPRARAVRPLGPRCAARYQALRSARVHHGRRRAADAFVPALRARRRRLERPAAQRLARDPAGIEGHRGDPGGCTRKVLALLEELATNDKEKYAKFWDAFGKVLKEGVGRGFLEQGSHRRLAAFRVDARRRGRAGRFVRRLRRAHEDRPGQDLLRHRRLVQRGAQQPASRVFRKKGIEVLLLSDRVDEWVVGHVTEFDGKSLVSVAKGGLDLGSLEDETEKKEREQESSELSDLIGRIKASLGDRVKEVRVTHRLTESPACLVADEHDMSGNLARLAESRWPAGTGDEADPGDQPQAPGRAAVEERGEEVRRLVVGAAGPGAPRRRRSARRSGDVRQAHQCADARNERRCAADHRAG
jgi:molecular chaperone HtpG